MLRRIPSEQIELAPAETARAKVGKHFKLFFRFRQQSYSRSKGRINAYLLGMASGRRFSCRHWLQIGSTAMLPNSGTFKISRAQKRKIKIQRAALLK